MYVKISHKGIFHLQGSQTTLYCCLEESIKDQSGLYYSNCREKRPSAKARNDEDAKRLWELSEKLVGLKPNEEEEKPPKE